MKIKSKILKATKASKAKKKPNAKPAAKVAKKPASKAKPAPKVAKVAKETKAEKPATAKPDKKPLFTPVTLPAVFHSPDGKGELTITATAITYAQGLREAIFDPKSAHYFAQDYKTGNPNRPIIKGGSVGVRRGGRSLIFGPENMAIFNAVMTAANIAKKSAKAKKGAK